MQNEKIKNIPDENVQKLWEEYFDCISSVETVNSKRILTCLMPVAGFKNKKYPLPFFKEAMTAYILKIPLNKKWAVSSRLIECELKAFEQRFPKPKKIRCPKCKFIGGLPLGYSNVIWAASVLDYFANDNRQYRAGNHTHICSSCDYTWKSKVPVDSRVLEYLEGNCVELIHPRPY